MAGTAPPQPAYRELVRWEQLFADLEAQLDALDAQDAPDVAELVRAEVARTALVDRLRAHVGAALTLRLTDGTAIAGLVVDAAPSWLLLDEGRGPLARALVPVTALVAVSGLSRSVAPAAGVVEGRLGLGRALRALARDRSPVQVQVPGVVLTGTVDRVGADHLDLAVHAPGEARRRAAVREVVTISQAGLLVVRTAPHGPA